MKIIVLVFAVIILPCFAQNFPKNWENKMEKAIVKQFSATVAKQEIKDDYINSKNKHLYKLVSGDTTKGYLYVSKTQACHIGGCGNNSTNISSQSIYEYFTYFVITDINTKILHIEMLEYAAERGFEICNKRWLSKFVGHEPKNLSYGRNIDAISGATISGLAITGDVTNINVILEENN